MFIIASNLIVGQLIERTRCLAGKARPLNPRSYLSDSTDTYYGEAMAVVRPNGRAKLYIASAYGEEEVYL